MDKVEEYIQIHYLTDFEKGQHTCRCLDCRCGPKFDEYILCDLDIPEEGMIFVERKTARRIIEQDYPGNLRIRGKLWSIKINVDNASKDLSEVTCKYCLELYEEYEGQIKLLSKKIVK